MTKREKNETLADATREANERKNEPAPTNAAVLRSRRTFLTRGLTCVAAAIWCAEIGCAGGAKRFLRRGKKNDALDPLTQTETTFRVGGRVERMEIAKNSKRILVKLRDFNDSAEDAYSAFFATGGVRKESEASEPVLELWNVEFLEARREAFDATDPIDVESAVFDDDGTRVFWTTRELERAGTFASSPGEGTRDGAEKSGTGIALVGATTAETSFGVRDASRREPSFFEPATRTVLATRAFESASVQEETGSEIATRLKISEAAKGAETIWLSPNARWVVGRVGRDDETSARGENDSDAQEGEPLTTGEWTLTLRRDRRRVVRFPKTVKMTFAESTSNETIEGRVVDVLAVSPAGDLVATLVEETAPDGQNGENSEFNKNSEIGQGGEIGETRGSAAASETSAASAFIPRFKIVIWDLSVPETVEWEKAKKPLRALEVAQIAVAGPVSRRFCRFSPNGQIFASRIDPRYISLWQAANGRLLVELGEHREDVSDFAFSPNGMKVAAATGLGARVVLWNVRKGAAHRTLRETAEEVSSIDAVAFSPDGGSVYFANDLGEIKRWDARAERRNAPSEEN
jgi:hypothetical protein